MMRKIKIRLPATVSGFGLGMHGLGIALGLYTTIEISGRSDSSIQFEQVGISAVSAQMILSHPVLLAMGRFFQKLEKAQLGIDIRVESAIPTRSGLGAEAAYALAGVLGANDLMGNLWKRNEVLALASKIEPSDGVVTSLLGGLTVSYLEGEILTYRSLPVAPFRVAVVYPELDDYAPAPPPEQIPRRDVEQHLSRTLVLVDALRTGDFKLVSNVFARIPVAAGKITGYGHVVEIARKHGAFAVIPCGHGPALMAFAESRHEFIAEEMQVAFQSAGVESKSWVVPLDTQGVVISAVQSA